MLGIAVLLILTVWLLLGGRGTYASEKEKRDEQAFNVALVIFSLAMILAFTFV